MHQSGRFSSRPSNATKKSSRVTLPNNAPSFAKTSSPSNRLGTNHSLTNPIHSPPPTTTSQTKPTRTIRVAPSSTTKQSMTQSSTMKSNMSQSSTMKSNMTATSRGYNSNKVNSMKMTPKSRSTPFISEKEIIKAISDILSNKISTATFSDVYKAAKNLSVQSTNEIYEQLKIEFSNRLDDLDISSIQKLINEWKKFQKEVNQIQSFMKFAGFKDIKNLYDTLPHWKYKETIKKHSNKCMTIGIEIWKSDVHSKALYILHDEIQNSIKSLSNDETVENYTKELFDLLCLLGHNCVDQVKEMFTTEYNSLDSSKSATERLFYIIKKTKKLAAVFSLNVLQPITVVPYMNELVPVILEKRQPEALVELKEFLLPEHVPKYTQIVIDQMKKVTLPIDYFSLVSFLEFYSSVLFNDAPVRTLVSTFISRGDSKFCQQFVSVIFGHFDLIQNVKQLSPLVPLYADKEQLSNELVRAFLLRMLQKRSTTKEKEMKFAKELLIMFSNEQMRQVFSMLRDYTIEGNIIVMNSSLTTPLISNDRSKIPFEYEQQIKVELNKFSEKFINRKFTISGAFSMFYVKAKWNGDKDERLIIMSGLQFQIIQMILMKDNNFKSTNANIDTLNMAMKFLVKSKIVKKAGNQFFISDEPPKEKRINIYMNAIDIRYNENKKLAQSHDHSMSIQSVISKVMKANRKMNENDLTNKVIEELSNLFNIRDGDIPKVIEHMIESEFIERDKSDTRYLLYIP